MSKIMIWVGQFDSEADVEKYMDQSAFRQWWKDYDEDNKELRCQFCKELGVMNYDEDFLIILKSATKPLNVLIAFTRPLITEFADNLNLKHPLLPTISPYPTM